MRRHNTKIGLDEIIDYHREFYDILGICHYLYNEGMNCDFVWYKLRRQLTLSFLRDVLYDDKKYYTSKEIIWGIKKIKYFIYDRPEIWINYDGIFKIIFGDQNH